MTRFPLAAVLPDGRPTAPRRSTPPSRAKALRYRLAEATRQTVRELISEAPVPLAVALIAAIGWFLKLALC